MNDVNREVETLRMKLKVLQRLEEIAGSSLQLEKALDSTLDLVIDITNSSAGGILLLEDEGKKLRFKTVKGEGTENLRGVTLSIGEGIAGWVAKTGIPQIVNDAEKGPSAVSYIPEKTGYKTKNALCVPLKIREEVIGVLEVVNKKGDSLWTNEDLEICELFSSRLATILENKRAYSLIEEKAERLSLLSDTSELISSTLDLNKLLEIVMEQAKEVLSAEASSIFRIDEAKKELYFVIATGERGEEAKEIRTPWGKGIVGACAEKEETILVHDVSKDPRWFSGVDKKSGFVTKSILAVPLKVKGKLIGVAEVVNKKDGTSFTKEDVELFEALARQAAVAIENARLYKDLEDMLTGTIHSVVSLIDAKDDYTAGHSARVTRYSLMIAEELGYPEEDKKRLRLSALLHDVGKIGMPDHILKKTAGLTDEEFAIVKEHPGRGAVAMKPIKQMAPMIAGIRHHHERIDGKGYPDGLKDGGIPLDAQIICVADAYDAMTSSRPYRTAMSNEVAIERLKKDSGTQFEPKLVECLANAIQKHEEERRRKNKIEN